jgi:hypothetical protein
MTQMLLEFETLDADDVEKMVKRQWNPEFKRAKLQASLAASSEPHVSLEKATIEENCSSEDDPAQSKKKMDDKS